VDKFINKVRELLIGKSVKESGLEMKMWFEIVAFDIFGEMTLGESFHAIETGNIPSLNSDENEGSIDIVPTGRPHFWPAIILRHLFFIIVLDNLRHCIWISYIGKNFRELLSIRCCGRE